MRSNLILTVKNNLLFCSLLFCPIFFWYSFNFCFFSSGILWYLFFHILSFSFYLLQISFYIYFFIALLIFLCFYDNKLYYPFFIYTKKKKNYKIPFLSIKLWLVINFFALRLLMYGKWILYTIYLMWAIAIFLNLQVSALYYSNHCKDMVHN